MSDTKKKCERCGTDGCPAAWEQLEVRVGDPILPATETLIDIACSLRSLLRSAPNLSDCIVTCPHGAVWCGVCITEKTAWYGSGNR